jgi:hypothetical protein
MPPQATRTSGYSPIVGIHAISKFNLLDDRQRLF